MTTRLERRAGDGRQTSRHGFRFSESHFGNLGSSYDERRRRGIGKRCKNRASSHCGRFQWLSKSGWRRGCASANAGIAMQPSKMRITRL
jgi:hypothetical protein